MTMSVRFNFGYSYVSTRKLYLDKSAWILLDPFCQHIPQQFV